MKFGRLAICIWLLIASPGFADDSLADHVLVKKSERMIYLMRGEDILAEYPISLGLVPKGHKVKEGDFRTPEGNYFLTRRLVESDFFMAIQVSYPNRWDEAKARNLGVRAGGRIMIHGQPMVPKKPASYYANFDWTDGCIAVSNEAMVNIWQLTSFNTPITILP